MAHRHRDAVHVLDLGDDLFGGATKSDIPTLIGERAVAAALEILGGELSGDFDGLGDGPAGNRTMIRNPHLIAVGIAEPEPADVFNAVVCEA